MLYKITLKPTGSFYFGGENSFGEAKSKGTSEEDIRKNYFAKRSAYFAKSEMFPQQTQLLGMLRKEIMRKQECLKLHNSGECIQKGKRDKAVKLVGLKWQENLGEIEQLSPLFLEKNKELFVPAPLDKSLSLVKSKGSSYINGRLDATHVYALKKENNSFFNAKDSLCYDYVSATSSLAIDSIFNVVTRVGNQTLGYSEDDEDQLYKISAYTLDKEVQFVCYLEVKTDLFDCKNGNVYESIVELGGERSMFKLEVQIENKKPSYEDIYGNYANNAQRVVLMSDSYVDASIFSFVDVSLSEKVPFRSIVSNAQGFAKSSKQMLLRKGTVFYPKEDNIQKVCESIDNEAAFKTIGYNQYITIDKK